MHLPQHSEQSIATELLIAAGGFEQAAGFGKPSLQFVANLVRGPLKFFIGMHVARVVVPRPWLTLVQGAGSRSTWCHGPSIGATTPIGRERWESRP